MTATLQTALLLARKFDSYIEGFALLPAMLELFALDHGGPLPIDVKENDAELAKQARGEKRKPGESPPPRDFRRGGRADARFLEPPAQ